MLRPRIRFRPLSRRHLPVGTGASLLFPGSFSASSTHNLSSWSKPGRVSSLETKPSLYLMPLGGSVTYGVGSSHGNGYRQFLREMLLADGYRVLFVGSRRSGSMSNGENEGWRGYRLDQIDQRARGSVPTLLPNVFTINAGSNDCIQDFQIEGFGQRMDNMLEYLWQTTPTSAVILSTLLVNADKQVNSRVSRVNDQLRELARVKASKQRNIVLADMNCGQGPQLEDLVDGTHPNDEGYKKMASIWFDAIRQTAP